MKKLITFTILLLILSSCGMDQVFEDNFVIKRSPDRYFNTSDPYFDEYKESFKDDYYLHTGRDINTNLPVNFSETIFFDKNPGSIGVCFSYNGKGLEILIKTSYWNRLSKACKKTLMHHEFAHCLLNQDHRDSHPSVMNTSNGYCDVMDDHENMFLEELFSRTQDSINYLKSLM